MNTHTVTTYTASELREKFPDGFERALENWRNRGDIAWQEETFDSLKGLIEAAGVKLRNYNLGAYNRGNGLTVEFPEEGAEDLTGARALAWLENNLFGPLRIPWRGGERWRLAKYGSAYRAGKVKPCPFTGYCADEEYIDALRESVRGGDTLKEAFEGLADTYATILEREIEDQNSPDYFCEHADGNDLEFEEDGTEF